jgi:hypothetical protein
MRAVWRFIVLYGIVAGLALTLPACRDFLDNNFCRPPGHCPNVAGKSGANNAGQ